MILLVLGTAEHTFDRAVERVLPVTLDDDLVVQHGFTRPRNSVERVTWIPFAPYDRVLELCSAASAVICHAGVGAIMTARSVGKTPLVMPRLARYGEAVDDHQLQIAEEFERSGLVALLGDQEPLGAALGRARMTHTVRGADDSLRRAIAAAVG